jgi:hypothetical protein
MQTTYPKSMHTKTPTPRVHLHGAKRPSSRRDRGGEETAARLARRRVALSHLIGVIAIVARVKITLGPLLVFQWGTVGGVQGLERINK